MSIVGSEQWMYASGGGSFYPVTIDDSLRWPTSGCQLYRTVGVPTDATKHTHSFWVKVNHGTTQTLNSVYGNASGYYSVSGINSDGRIIFAADYARYYYSTMVLRDPSAWVHILQVLDSTEASSSDRMKLYVNGVRQTSFTNFATVPLNWTGSYHATNGLGLRIGSTYTGAGFQSSLLSYTSEYIFVDGQALDPTDFGQFIDGVWVPDTYAGTYGNNGYKLDFSNPANFGEDSSGNSNNFSVTGLAAHDAMPDTPTNNFATWNYNSITNYTYTSTQEGSLKANMGTGAGTGITGTFSCKGGKWYWEVRASNVGNGLSLGITTGSGTFSNMNTNGIFYDIYGNKRVFGTTTASAGATWAAGDVIGMAVDADSAGTIAFYKNNVLQFTVTESSILTKDFLPWVFNNSSSAGSLSCVNFGQDGTFAGAITAGGNQDDNGVGDFKYAPPAGYLALCTANLPTPTIVDGSEHFNTVLFNANNSTQSITGVGFQPDWVWTKSRANAYHHGLYDSVRGVNLRLRSSTTDAEVSQSNMLNSFDADGFSLGQNDDANYLGSSVAWNWKAGGAAVSNTDGSITSQVSANVDAGFSVLTFSGTGANATVGHGLGVAPSMVIMKQRNLAGFQWPVYHSSLGTDKFLFLQRTDGQFTSTSIWQNTAPSSSVIYLGANGNDNNNTGSTMVAYCFADVDGFSKAGSYVGNGSTDGPFVYTGFRPAWVLVKSSTQAYEWVLHDTTRDPFNFADNSLSPNDATAEAVNGAPNSIDILSNGFKIRANWTRLNDVGQTFIYLAFAENPFKYSNAR